MQRTIRALAVLAVGLAFLVPVPPPPAYSAEDAGVQEESEADERKAWEQFNEGFNREQDGRKRQFLQGEEHLVPFEWTALSLLPESLQRIFRITPAKYPTQFKSIKNSEAVQHERNGSIWEKDRDQHGGSWWKVWLDRHKWEGEHKTAHYSIRENGDVWKGPKK